MVKVLLVEDHMVVRSGIKMLLNSSTDFEVVAEGGEGGEAIKFLDDGGQADLVITDIQMTGIDGLALLEYLRKQHPKIKVVMFSVLADLHVVIGAFSKGLSGYLVKNVEYNELMFALRHISNGGTYLCAELSKKLIETYAQYSSGPSYIPTNEDGKIGLNEREIEVLKFIAQGLTNGEIAEKIFLSKRTVEGYRLSLIEKAQVKNTAQLITFAFQNGLLI
ncbi:response regulator [Sphingobacterium sp. Mn56C]|uniref:response regulator n=1 Tax=Sphingobacterium sp. Mn56C TaxID=3395261 RepID=UPI003BCA6249